MTFGRAPARGSVGRSDTVKRVMVLEFPLFSVAMSRSHGALPESPLKPGLNVKACFEAKGSSWGVCVLRANYLFITLHIETNDSQLIDNTDLYICVVL